MHKKSEEVSSQKLSEIVVHGMMEKKAAEIRILDLRAIKHAISDYFIICSGNSDTQIDSIADAVEDEVRKITGQKPWKKEGYQNKEWVLIDYVDVVAHIFIGEKREFYALEELWADAKVQEIEEIPNQ